MEDSETVKGPHGQDQCPQHQGNEVIYLCEDCRGLACIDCVSTLHKRHALLDLKGFIPNMKNRIQDFVQKTKQIDIPHIKEKLQTVNNDLKNNGEHFKKLITEIKAENSYIKRELDRLTESFVETCRDMKLENDVILFNHKKELQDSLGELDSKIQEYSITLKSGGKIQLYNTATDIQKEFKQIPTKPELPSVQFLPLFSKQPQIQHLLGELLVQWSGEDLKPVELKYQPTAWKVASMITPFQDLMYATSMHITPGNKILASVQNCMLLTDQSGQTQQELKVTTNIYDFCLSYWTQEIWYTCVDQKSVTAMRDGKSSVMFETDQVPLSICVTSDDHIVIGHEGQVVKYTENGQVIAKTSSGGTLRRYPWRSPPSVTYPWRIRKCPVTHNLAVIDWDVKKLGGKGTPFVSILNDKLQVLYTYRGNRPGHQSASCPFSPRDVCYTKSGELIVIDKDNRSVLCLSGKGEYQQTLYTHSSSRPMAVCVDNDHRIFVTYLQIAVYR